MRRSTVIGAIAFVAILAACGSSSKSGSAGTTTTLASTPATPTPTLAPATTTSTTVNPNAPAVTATPSTGLTNGEKITVTGTHFPPGTKVGITECADKGNATGAADCDLAGLAATIKLPSANGTYTDQFTVTNKPGATDAACGAAQPCVISVGSLSATGPHPSTSLTFKG